MSIEKTLRQAFDRKTRFARNPTIDTRYVSETADIIEIEVKHRKTGVYNCYVECEFKEDIFDARLLQAESIQTPGEYATRSTYIALQNQINEMSDHVFLIWKQSK